MIRGRAKRQLEAERAAAREIARAKKTEIAAARESAALATRLHAQWIRTRKLELGRVGEIWLLGLAETFSDPIDDGLATAAELELERRRILEAP